MGRLNKRQKLALNSRIAKDKYKEFHNPEGQNREILEAKDDVPVKIDKCDTKIMKANPLREEERKRETAIKITNGLKTTDSLICRKCNKQFTSKQHRNRHETKVCNLPKRQYKKDMKSRTTDNAENVAMINSSVSIELVLSNAEQNMEASSGNSLEPPQKIKINEHDIHKDDYVGQECQNINVSIPKLPYNEAKPSKTSIMHSKSIIPKMNKEKLIYPESLTAYNKRIRARFNRINGRRCAFVAVLISSFAPTFSLTTMKLHTEKVSSGYRNVEQPTEQLKFVDLTNENIDNSDKVIREYRTKCIIKGKGILENKAEITFYNLNYSNLLPAMKDGELFYIYINGVNSKTIQHIKKQKYTANDKTLWTLLNNEYKVVQCHPEFGTSEQERAVILEKVLELNEIYAQERNRIAIPINNRNLSAPSALNLQNQVVIGPIVVDFPYKPYEAQRTFMEAVIKSCEERKNALLESPTGTGKSLSLFCSILAWKHYRNLNGRIQILYLSRTHKQLGQIIEEIKRTSYNPVTILLGSKNKLCPMGLKNFDHFEQNYICESLRKEQKCTRLLTKNPWLKNSIVDIEDIDKTIGSNICPYHAMKGLSKLADVVLMPYSYVIDPFVRKTITDFSFENSILIFDEAHNLPRELEGIAGLSISSSELMAYHFDTKCQLYCQIQAVIIFVNSLDFSTQLDVISVIEKLGQIIIGNNMNYDECIGALKQHNKELDFKTNNKSLKKWLNFTFKVFYLSPLIKSNFRFFRASLTSSKNSKILSIKCYNPAIVFNDIIKLKPRTIILASGTLSPMEIFEKELGNLFDIKLANQHVIQKENSFVNIIGHEFDPEPFNFSFGKRNNTLYLKLSHLLIEICNTTTGGILVFFPSYSMLDDFIKCSSSNYVWKSLKRTLFRESSKGILCSDLLSSVETLSSIEEYREKSLTKETAILFIVCRGKISEGINFRDNEARAVIIVGVPFVTPDENRKKIVEIYQKMTYNDWYCRNAMIAVNQCIGRAFRHKNDYAAIILIDERFEEHKILKLLPSWLQEYKIIESTSQCVINLSRFFITMKEKSKNFGCFDKSYSELTTTKSEMNKVPVALDFYSHWSSHYFKYLFFRKKRRFDIIVKEENKDD